MITNEALRILTNNLTFTRYMNRSYDSSFGVEGAKIGTTLNVRNPIRYLGGEGPALSIEDITETSVPVVLNRQPHVGITFTSQDLKLNIDDFSRRIIAPAVASIANKIDFAGLQLYKQVYNFVGVPGTIPADLDVYLNAQTALNNNATPQDGQRNFILTPAMEAKIVFALKGLFQSSTQIKEQYEKGKMGTAAGGDWSMDQNCATHVVGTVGTGNPLVNTSNQVGSSIVTDGWVASIANTLRVGDIVQFAGVFQINPQNRQSTGVLQPFVVTADCDSDSGGNITIPISPAIVPAGAYQNVSALAADNAIITVFGIGTASFAGLTAVSTPQGMLFHPDAFTLACADLPLPGGVDNAARASDPDIGLSLRMIRQYSIMTDQWPCRVDVLFGVAALRPELACRICS